MLSGHLPLAFALATLLLACPAMCEDSPYSGRLERSQIVMRWARGPNVPDAGLMLTGWMTYEISCNGRLAATFEDSSGFVSSVAPDSALALARDLAAHDFFGMPEVFRAEHGELQVEADSLVAVSRVYRDFGLQDRITLQLGARAHTIVLNHPAPAAPEWLLRWRRRFGVLLMTGSAAVEH